MILTAAQFLYLLGFKIFLMIIISLFCLFFSFRITMHIPHFQILWFVASLFVLFTHYSSAKKQLKIGKCSSMKSIKRNSSNVDVYHVVIVFFL